MASKRKPKGIEPVKNYELPKAPTGIQGLDEITYGGLPKGRPTLIAGTAGCGKTLMAMEFLVHGAMKYGENGVFIAFEEREEDLDKNVRSLGFNVAELVKRKKLFLDHIKVERSEIQETGDYDLEGLFLRIEAGIQAVGAKRVVLDTLETLFAGFTNAAVLRAELRRLFGWLKERGVTAIITGERGDASITRQGLEEYVSDCVILLDHHVHNQISTRRLRVVKYRGSKHGTNEYPYLIDEDGISVLPITSIKLNHPVSNERVPSGIPRLDNMLGGKGYYQGSSVLISGTAGTGKTTVSSSFAVETARRGGRVLYFAFEESPAQIMRNMRSVGIDLQKYVNRGLIRFHATRPQFYGLEMHLVAIHKLISQFQPAVVILDPISNLINSGTQDEVTSILNRLLDFLKMRQITSLFTSLSHNRTLLESNMVSSLMDTWILLRDIEMNGERNKGIFIMKSRGMPHSTQIREFKITKKGINLVDVYLGAEGVLTGSARAAQEAKEKAALLIRKQEIETKRRNIQRKRKALEAQIASLRAEFSAEEEELEKILSQEQLKENTIATGREAMGKLRGADQ